MMRRVIAVDVYTIIANFLKFLVLCLARYSKNYISLQWKINCKAKDTMKKVVNASVGGRSFSFDDDAYARLVAYFDHFKARLNKDSKAAEDEVMSDLENRIAELFDQGIGGASYRVVDLPLVTRVVSQLGMPDGSAEPLYGSTGTSSEGRQECRKQETSGPDFSYAGDKGNLSKRLYRDPDNKAIGGVCAGLAAFLNIDITIVRIILLLALLLWGSGLIVYLVLWIVVPLAKTPAEKCEMRGLDPTAENMARFSNYGK